MSKSRFRVGDRVTLIVRGINGIEKSEGPYIVESVPSLRKYTLCLSNGQQVKNGIEIERERLEDIRSMNYSGCSSL